MGRAFLELFGLRLVLLGDTSMLLRLMRDALCTRLLRRGLLAVALELASEPLLLLAALDLPLPHPRQHDERNQGNHGHDGQYHDDCRHSFTSTWLSLPRRHKSFVLD